MTTPRDQIRALVTSDLALAVNLRALSQLANQLFHQRPVLYGSLARLFDALLGEYDDYDAIPTDRADRIRQDLTAPILGAIDAEFDPPAKLLEKLNDLYRTWFAL